MAGAGDESVTWELDCLRVYGLVERWSGDGQAFRHGLGQGQRHLGDIPAAVESNACCRLHRRGGGRGVRPRLIFYSRWYGAPSLSGWSNYLRRGTVIS